MKKSSLMVACIIVFQSQFSFGQTKMISHKSHSGSAYNFKKSISINSVDIGTSNFGIAPERFVRNSKLDTVKLLSRNVAVMITSESCYSEGFNGGDRSSAEIWSAGTDTVLDHPVFNGKNSLNTIKSTLKNNYYFDNSIDKVVFIGFDGKYALSNPKAANETRLNEAHIEKNTFGKKHQSYFMIILLSLLSTVFRGQF